MPTTTPGFTYEGSDVRVVDGDTLEVTLTKTETLRLDVGFHVRVEHVVRSSTRQKLRLKGINCPEVHGPTKDAGLAAKAATTAFLATGTIVTVTTFKPVKGEDEALDLYGRYLAIVYVDGKNLNQHLLDHGFAVAFMVD